MKFSTITSYGLRAMINLAKNHNRGSISLSKIAKTENISSGYLEKIFSKLKKAKLIKSAKGPTGGYILSASPSKISISRIIKCLEGEKSLFYCLHNNQKINCSQKCHCGVNKVLTNIEQAIKNSLDKLKLSDLIQKL
ncbi:hypothetical protein AUJ27_03035 [Candidatus Falkowbacteria bacterium CG1_02_37_44]|nr:MAG: hypothetical protein AUJ27_03035 [Candidatus Falkowbacteria bacterium CG1_02_37_44]